MMTRALKTWTTPSGNRCNATLTVDGGGDSVAIRFSWESRPSAEDRDFYYKALTEAVGLAEEALFQLRAIHDVLIKLWVEGKIEPVETDEHGERVWIGTEKFRREALTDWQKVSRLAGNVIPLPFPHPPTLN